MSKVQYVQGGGQAGESLPAIALPLFRGARDSARIASVGWTRVAERAGSRVAVTATATRRAAPPSGHLRVCLRLRRQTRRAGEESGPFPSGGVAETATSRRPR